MLTEQIVILTKFSVFWLKHDETLEENRVKEGELLLMKRKFYHSEDSMTKE